MKLNCNYCLGETKWEGEEREVRPSHKTLLEEVAVTTSKKNTSFVVRIVNRGCTYGWSTVVLQTEVELSYFAKLSPCHLEIWCGSSSHKTRVASSISILQPRPKDAVECRLQTASSECSRPQCSRHTFSRAVALGHCCFRLSSDRH